MWYFAWVLGIGFAVLLAILNALWGENEEMRASSRRPTRDASDEGNAAHAGAEAQAQVATQSNH